MSFPSLPPFQLILAKRQVVFNQLMRYAKIHASTRFIEMLRDTVQECGQLISHMETSDSHTYIRIAHLLIMNHCMALLPYPRQLLFHHLNFTYFLSSPGPHIEAPPHHMLNGRLADFVVSCFCSSAVDRMQTNAVFEESQGLQLQSILMPVGGASLSLCSGTAYLCL